MSLDPEPASITGLACIGYAVRIRMVREARLRYPDLQITRAEAAVTAAWHVFDGADRETVVVLALNPRLYVNALQVVAVGELDNAPVHPREVFKVAIEANAASIVLMHNHTSGDTTPSSPDVGITRRLVKAGEILGIPLDDHIIVGPDSGPFTSMRQAGFMDADHLNEKGA